MRASRVSLLRERNSPRAGGGSKKTELCVALRTKSAQKGGPPIPLTPSLATADAGKVTKYSILHLLEWGGWQARTRDENFPRGGGAAASVLSSVCEQRNHTFRGKVQGFRSAGELVYANRTAVRHLFHQRKRG